MGQYYDLNKGKHYYAVITCNNRHCFLSGSHYLEQLDKKQRRFKGKTVRTQICGISRNPNFLTMLTENDKQLDAAIGPFSDTCQRSRFLFGQAVHEYLEVIRLKAFDTQFQKTVMANPVDYDDSQQHIKKYSETKIWYHKQLTVILEKFDPFLSFGKNR